MIQCIHDALEGIYLDPIQEDIPRIIHIQCIFFSGDTISFRISQCGMIYRYYVYDGNVSIDHANAAAVIAEIKRSLYKISFITIKYSDKSRVEFDLSDHKVGH